MKALFAALAFFFVLHASSIAVPAKNGLVFGKVETESGQPLQGVNIYIEGTNLGDVSDTDGTFEIKNIPVGTIRITAHFVGRESQSRTIEIAEDARINQHFSLALRPLLLPGVVVTASQTALGNKSLNALSANIISRDPAPVTGQLIRRVPGVEAVRRGPVGLDPVVRGLRETEVGSYIDGSRMFPAGPARMDSPISHIDPNAIRKLEVIKGPYALTLGAGNLSAIRVTTADLPLAGEKAFSAMFTTGYQTNLNATNLSASALGNYGRTSYWISSTWRSGDDYRAGGSRGDIPANFLSREIRGKLDFMTGRNSRLTLSGGYQRQDDMDYPGRLLNADFFRASNFALDWDFQKPNGLLRKTEINVYRNRVDHRMDNDGKPTALPDPSRVPPFALNIGVDSEISVIGGRASSGLIAGPWHLEFGGDIYSTNRNATRTIARAETGTIMFTDLMWPDANITDAGFFGQVSRQIANDFDLAATVRLDAVHAKADTASEFFLANASEKLDASETEMSAALTISKPLSQHVTACIGAGSVVRTADGTERYSDRIPSSKAQTAAEFMGNPALKPERSNQVDLWFDINYDKLSISANAFYRQIDNYITLEATILEKRLPLSPNTVFRYINGDASFWGIEASVLYQLSDDFTSVASLQYLRATDRTLDEPVLGIAPFSVDLRLKYEKTGSKVFAESAIKMVAKQNRVARTRGELPTEGYFTLDLNGGVRLWSSFELRLGILNLLDKHYIDHLNAKNPFTGMSLPEPGRVLYANLNYAL